MFVEKLASNATDAVIRDGLDAFCASLGELAHPISFDIGHRELPAGVPSTYVDLYPSDWVQKHESFGGIYVRVWRVGSPAQLVYGIFLGAERAQQSEPRRAAAFIRGRMAAALSPIEAQHGFNYSTWGDADINWGAAGSVRAVSRQMEQFVTFKRTSEIDAAVIEADIALLIRLIDNALPLLGSARQFGMKVLELYYGQNLPQDPSLPGIMTETQPITHGGASDAGTNWMASAEVDWDLAAVPAWGDLKGLEGPYHRAIAALRAGKHVIFLGPPGSGKTELAEFICKTLQRTFRSVTATSEWSGFETIGGYLPSPDGEAVNGGRLDFNPGLVVQALEQQEWLVLDELNRADLDKCFGELFTLLGGGTKSIRLPFKRRGADGSYRPVVLAHSPGTTDDDTVVIPPSWRIIGTMNTTDKASLYQLSYAFMRRFAFINVGVPTPDQYTEIILAAIDREVTNGGEKAPLEALYDPIALMFAQNTSGTLRAAGIEFGPALALDVIRYVGSRSKQLKDPASLLEEALELLVFPQLEGMRQKYSEVISATGTALSRSLSDEAAASLRMWTGHYE